MKKTFEYAREQATFTSAEVAAIITRHAEFVKASFVDHVSKEDHDKTVAALKVFTDKKDYEVMYANLETLTDSKGKIKALIKNAEITAEDTKEIAIAKANKVLANEEFSYLKPAAGWTPEAADKPNTKAKGVVPEFDTPESKTSTTKTNTKETTAIPEVDQDELGEIPVV